MDQEPLRQRFPKANDAILFCIHAMLSGASPQVASLLPLAAEQGLVITADTLVKAEEMLRGEHRATAPPPPRPTGQAKHHSKPRQPVPQAQDDLGDEMLKAIQLFQTDADHRAEDMRQSILAAIRALQSCLE